MYTEGEGKGEYEGGEKSDPPLGDLEAGLLLSATALTPLSPLAGQPTATLTPLAATGAVQPVGRMPNVTVVLPAVLHERGPGAGTGVEGGAEAGADEMGAGGVATGTAGGVVGADANVGIVGIGVDNGVAAATMMAGEGEGEGEGGRRGNKLPPIVGGLSGRGGQRGV